MKAIEFLWAIAIIPVVILMIILSNGHWLAGFLLVLSWLFFPFVYIELSERMDKENKL